MRINLLIEGAMACFRRPEMAESLVTYDAMPPAIAFKILSTIYSPAKTTWRLSHIHVLKPVASRWGQIRTSRGVIPTFYLIDVAYLVVADLEYSVAGMEHEFSFAKALHRGGERVHLGLRDYDARLSLPASIPVSSYAGSGSLDLGWMLHDFGESGRSRARYFRAAMVNGVIEMPASTSLVT